MKNLLILFTILALANPSPAEETIGVGLTAGFASGFGFSVRYMPESGLGLQASAIYIKTDDFTFSNVGLQPFYVLNRSKNSSLYVVGGAAYHYKRTVKERTTGTYPFERTEEVTSYRRRWAYGLGMGLAYRNAEWDKLWASVELLLTSYRGDVFPYPQVAVHYFFR